MKNHGKVWCWVSLFFFTFLLYGGVALAAVYANEVLITIPSGQASYVNSGAQAALDTQGDNESASAICVYAEYGSDPLSFENSTGGWLSSTATAGEAATGDTGAYSTAVELHERPVSTFTNSGTIESTAGVGDVTGDNLSARADSTGINLAGVDTFHNACCVTSMAQVGDALGDDSASRVLEVNGVYVASSINTFNNEGNISVAGTVGVAQGESSFTNVHSVQGVYVESSTGSFTNSGTISASATVGGNVTIDDDTVFVGAYGSNASASAVDIYGVYLEGNVDTFENTGTDTISATVTVGDAYGDYAGVETNDVAAVDFESGVEGSFTNSGTINTVITLGNASGDVSQSFANDVFGIRFGSVESFTNSGTIGVSVDIGDASGDSGYIGEGQYELTSAEAIGVYGISFGGDVGTFENTGDDTIEASVTLGDASGTMAFVYSSDVYGVYCRYGIDSFSNSGTVKANVTPGDASGEGAEVQVSDVYGVDFEEGVTSFTNGGTIEARVQVGDASGEALYDDYWGGYDTAYASVRNVYGVYAGGDVGTFENTGDDTIGAYAVVGDASGGGASVNASDVYGVDIDGGVDSFTNGGTIEARVQVGDASGEALYDYDWGGYDTAYARASDVYGVYVDGDVGTFENTGDDTIGAHAVVGDASGGGAYVKASDVYGVDIGGGVDSFTNSGTIEARAQVGDASGEALYDDYWGGYETASVRAHDVCGVYVGGDVGTFENTGDDTIGAYAVVGDASGGGADAKAYEIYGVDIGGGVDSFTNSGTIEARAQVGDASGEVMYDDYWGEYNASYAKAHDVYGVYVDGDVGTFENTGEDTISASVQVGSASGTVANAEAYDVYGVDIEGGVDSFTNSGRISASATVGDASGDGAYAGAYDIYGVLLDRAGDSFTNSGTIEVTTTVGDASGDESVTEVYESSAVSIGGTGEGFSLENSGTISNSATLGDASGYDSWAEAYWITGATVNGDVDSFTNSGNVTTHIQMGKASGEYAWSDAYGISGVEIWGDVNSFSNSGNIEVGVTIGDPEGNSAEGDNSYVSTFNEYYNAGVYGVYIGNNVDVIGFENTGSIEASTEVGNASGEGAEAYSGHVLGVDIGSSPPGGELESMVKGRDIEGDDGGSEYPIVSSFTNRETIKAWATVGDASGNNSTAEAFSANSVWVDYSEVEEFDNSGTLEASLTAGSATGSNSWVGLYDAGVGILGPVGTFTNSGTISTRGTMGNAEGNGSTTWATWLYGAYFGGDVDTFENSGSVKAFLTSGYVAPNGGSVVSDIYGVGFDGYVGSFSNTSSDTIGAYVTVGAGNEEGEVAMDLSDGESGDGSYGGIQGYQGVYNVQSGFFTAGAGSITNTGTMETKVHVAGDVTGYLEIGGAFLIGGVQPAAIQGDLVSMNKALGDLDQLTQYDGGYEYGDFAPVSGLYLGGHVDSLDNQGTISSDVGVDGIFGGGWSEIYNVYGVTVVDTDTVESITNAGTIASAVHIGSIDSSSNSSVGWGGNVAGVYALGTVDSLTNTGTIGASYNIDSIDYSGWGYIENVAGVYSDGHTVDSLTNSGTISGAVNIGSMDSGSWGYVGNVAGVYSQGPMTSLTNSGTISGSVTITSMNNSYMYDFLDDGPGVLGIYGVRMDGTMGTFENSGTVGASVTAGSMTGSFLYAEDVVGASFGDDVDSFENTGEISAGVMAANDSDSFVNADSVMGVSFGGSVGSFSNTGSIGSFVFTGDNASISRVAALHLGGGGDITNDGELVATVNVGANSQVDRVAGVYITGGNGATGFTNNGDIYINVDPGVDDGTTITHVAGIILEGAQATLSNPGYIHLATDHPQADVRLVTLLNGSDATLEGPFGITFGEDPDITQEPFYVDGTSILRLNDSRVVARAGNYLRFNYPYYLIENEGEVDGTFGGLVDDTANPYISPTWYGPDRGEDAAVIWKFDPDESTASLSLHASRTIARNTLGFVTSHIMYDRLQWWVSENEEATKPVKVASSGQIASEAGPGLGKTIITKEYKNGAFVYPIYTDVEADDLGYDAHAYGMVLGVERRITNAMSLGLFGGFTTATVKYNDWDNGGKEDDQDIYHLGIFTNYSCGHWYVGLTALGYLVQHDYEGRTGVNYDLKERADYWSRGFEGELVGGYTFGDQKSWMLMPEVGIGYSHYWLSDYRTDAEISAWDRKYNSDDDGYFRSIVGLTGLKRWFAKDTKIDLLASVRWEQALDDNDITITESIPGLHSGKEDVEEDPGDTSIVGRLGLSFIILDRAKINFTFRSEFNEDYTVYSGRISLGVSF